MGWIEIYIIVMLVLNFGFACYFTGIGELPSHNEPPFLALFARWIVILPLVGRVFGWW